MDIDKKLYYDYLNIKLTFGVLRINVISITYYPFKPKKKISNHCHGTYELHFIKSGKGIVNINSNIYPVNEGIFYLTGPEIFHEQIADELTPMAEFSLNFDYEILNHHLSKNDSTDEFNRILDIIKENNFHIANDEFRCIDIFEKIFDELENKYFGYYESIKNHCFQIILNTIRCFLKNKDSNFKVTDMDFNDLRRKLLDDLFCYHYATTNVDIAAKTLKISKRQLDRVVKHYYGTSFQDKLLSVKIEQAKFVLLNTDIPICDIAANLGFTSSSYFSRIFKKKKGVSPKELRQ